MPEESRVELCSDWGKYLATPKSRIFICPDVVSMMFSGLISQ
jgi:hypothetical protein